MRVRVALLCPCDLFVCVPVGDYVVCCVQQKQVEANEVPPEFDLKATNKLLQDLYPPLRVGLFAPQQDDESERFVLSSPGPISVLCLQRDHALSSLLHTAPPAPSALRLPAPVVRRSLSVLVLSTHMHWPCAACAFGCQRSSSLGCVVLAGAGAANLPTAGRRSCFDANRRQSAWRVGSPLYRQRLAQGGLLRLFVPAFRGVHARSE